MYAIVEIAGQQFKVSKDQKVYVNRLEGAEKSKITFDRVLLIENNGNINIGAPAIKGAGVTAKILKHLKSDKIIVFKKKRRKGYKNKNGHRQFLSEIQVEDILESNVNSTKKEKSTKVEKTKKNTSTKSDDLKKIEGIGPKISETLISSGIVTFEDLAKSKPSDIAEIISKIRGNHVTDTWPRQAKLAAEGKWDQLKKLQDKLDGGVEK